MRRTAERWAPWIAVAVLVAGIASYAATRLDGGTSSAPAAPAGTQAETSVPLDPQARAVAREFVATAVARKRLDDAWRIAAPELRQDLTLARWETGTIPVQPYPVAQATAHWKVASSYADRASFKVTFVPRTKQAQGGTFLLALRRVGGRWLVSTWVPQSVVGPHG
jgi:hypothetical protein